MSTQVLSSGFGRVSVQRAGKVRNEAPSLTLAFATAAMALSVVVADRYLSVWCPASTILSCQRQLS